MTITDFLSVRIQHGVAALIGSAGARPLLGWFTWADAASVLAALSLAALGQLALLTYTRRARRGAPVAAAPTRHHMAVALGSPLAALIWVYGFYLAATPLLVRLIPNGGASRVRQGMDVLINLIAFVALAWFLYRATRGVEARLSLWARTSGNRSDELLVALLGASLRVVVIAAALIVGLSLLELPPQRAGLIGTLTSIVLIVSVALLLSRTVNTLRLLVLARFDTAAVDNLRARQVYTQLHIITRIIYVAIGLFTVAAILMLFPTVRHVGTSLLASAGIAGVVVGFASQKVLGNLFAGVQIAFTQTIRQDDVVVVEGEWGRVEEITLSYVVVHIWDDRRLVLPLSYFIEKPFQNWTRSSAALTGSVFIWVDYSFDVAAARAALKQIVEGSELWDRRFWNLQVSELTEKGMQLRVLATAADSSRSWDFRCQIREQLIAYIQRNHPESLPRSRSEVVAPGATPAAR